MNWCIVRKMLAWLGKGIAKALAVLVGYCIAVPLIVRFGYWYDAWSYREIANRIGVIFLALIVLCLIAMALWCNVKEKYREVKRECR